MIVPQASCIDIQHVEWDADKKQLINIETMPELRHMVMCEPCRVEFVADILACFMRLREQVAAKAEPVARVQ